MTIDVKEVKKRLVALIHDPNIVYEYIRSFGPVINIKQIKKIKEQYNTAIRVTESGIGKDPIFDIKYTCPVCGQHNITAYELKSKSQQIFFNIFNTPIYKGTSAYKTVDFSVLYTTVCHRCLFASPDKHDFIRQDNALNRVVRSQLTSNIIMKLQEKISERKALIRTIRDYNEYFTRPRTDDAAISSIRLSMNRATVETWFELPYSYYKLGSYALRIAKIQKDIGYDNRETLRQALEYFEEAFRNSNCPSEDIEMQVIYTIIALLMRFKELKKANSYMGVFANIRTMRLGEMKSNSKLNTQTIDKWYDKSKFIWEDRDSDSIFKDV